MPWLDVLFAGLAGATMAAALSSLANDRRWGPRTTQIDQAALAIVVGFTLAGSHWGQYRFGNSFVGIMAGAATGGVAATVLRRMAARRRQALAATLPTDRLR